MPDERTRDEIVDAMSPPAAAAIRTLDRLERIEDEASRAHRRLTRALARHIQRLAEYMVADDQARGRLVHDALVATSEGVE